MSVPRYALITAGSATHCARRALHELLAGVQARRSCAQAEDRADVVFHHDDGGPVRPLTLFTMRIMESVPGVHAGERLVEEQ